MIVDVPRCYRADIDVEKQSFVLVLEEAEGRRSVDQITGVGYEDAVTALQELADIHAPHWGADLSSESETFLPFNGELLPQILPDHFAGDWAKARPKVLDELPADFISLCDNWSVNASQILEGMHGTDTLCHGDYRSDNLLFDADGKVLALDYQLASVGHGMTDVAYFISQSVDDEVAATCGEELIAAYAKPTRPTWNRARPRRRNGSLPRRARVLHQHRSRAPRLRHRSRTSRPARADHASPNRRRGDPYRRSPPVRLTVPNDLVTNSCCLTLAGATQVLEAAISHATAIRRAFCIAVTDTSGEPIVTARMDGAPRISAGIAANKAYTVAGFGGMPTSSWWDNIKDDASLVHGITHTPGLVVFGGGVGVFVDGLLVGAIGVSGGSTEQDTAVATAGAGALIQQD